MKIANIQNAKIARLSKKQNLSFKMNYANFNSCDIFQKNLRAEELKLKQQLKDEELLYEIFTNQETNFPTEVLNDPSFVKELFYDVDYMKASNKAFKRIIEDRLQDENLPLDSKDRSELAVLYSLFSWQEEMFNDPRNSFEVGLENLKSEAKNKRHLELYNKPLQPAFCSIFNYGFINKPKTRKQKAEAIVNRAATKAAGESAVFLQFSTALETALLTKTTVKMCHDICNTYQMPGGTTSALLAELSGAFAGKTLASLATKWFPGVGNVANATITYSLHQATGRAIIKWCEKNYNNPDIKDLDNVAKGVRIFRFLESITPNPVEVLGDLDL